MLFSIFYCLFEAQDEILCREFGQVFSEKKGVNLCLRTLLECHYAYYFISACGSRKLKVSMLHNFELPADLCLDVMVKYLYNKWFTSLVLNDPSASLNWTPYGPSCACRQIGCDARALARGPPAVYCGRLTVDLGPTGLAQDLGRTSSESPKNSKTKRKREYKLTTTGPVRIRARSPARTTVSVTIENNRDSDVEGFAITAYLPQSGWKKLKLQATPGMTVQEVVEAELPEVGQIAYQVYQFPSRALLNPE